MRWLTGILLLLVLGLQYRLWVGDDGLPKVRALRGEIVAQKRELEQLRTRNRTLEAEVLDLREGLDALEEHARSELGMIKQGEMFLQVIEESDQGVPQAPTASAAGSPTAEPRKGEGRIARQGSTADARRGP